MSSMDFLKWWMTDGKPTGMRAGLRPDQWDSFFRAMRAALQ